MNKYLILAYNWYEQRVTRERILVLLLSAAFLYGIFYLFLFNSLDAREADLRKELKQLRDQSQAWQLQIDTLKQISNTALYKQWLSQHKNFTQLQNQYQHLINKHGPSDWRNVVKSALEAQKNVTLVQLKDYPDAAYLSGGNQSSQIFQQKHLIVVYSNFFDTIDFISKLESLLPNVKWDSLNYQVTNYPIAQVQMEFSIFYEKKS